MSPLTSKQDSSSQVYSLQYEEYINEVNAALECFLPDTQIPQKKLLDAMRYSLLLDGKRLRPIFLLEFCKMCGGNAGDAMPFACALEMVHVYSLIHDDLPCMDNDDTRRGKPSNHIVFGEATALLAGSALLSRAFEIMLEEPRSVPAHSILRAAHTIAAASGLDGIAGGQQLDLCKKTIDSIKEIHSRKTAAMFVAAAVAGCIVAGASPVQIDAAGFFGGHFGVAFQLADDYCDAEDECSAVHFMGADACREMALRGFNNALNFLDSFDSNGFAKWLVNRMMRGLV